jgi:predicted DNA-binding protein
MAMLTLRIDDELNDRLTALAEKSGRTKTHFVKRLLSDAISELEDEIWFQEQAAEIMAEYSSGKPRKYISHEQLMKEIGLRENLDPRILAESKFETQKNSSSRRKTNS